MNRLYLVAKREWILEKKGLFVYALVIAGIVLVNVIGQDVQAKYGVFPQDDQSYGSLFSLALYLGGVILTANAFRNDLFTVSGQHQYLMLPADNWQKFLVKAVQNAVAYPLVLALYFFLLSLVGETVGMLFLGSPFRPFNPFPEHLRYIGYYLSLQSMFLLGSVLFRKHQFFKTVLLLACILIAGSLLIWLSSRFAFLLFGREWHWSGFMILGWLFEAKGAYRVLVDVLYFAVLPVFCWVTAFFRMREVQSIDAIQH